jgi:3-keto-disaccharide hydrolase
MRYLATTCLLLATISPASAQEKANTLTPKEVADGWILLFDGETTFGWADGASPERKTLNGVKVESGRLILQGKDVRGDLFTRCGFADCEIHIEHDGEGSRRIDLWRRKLKDSDTEISPIAAFVGKGGRDQGLITRIQCLDSTVTSETRTRGGKLHSREERKFVDGSFGPTLLNFQLVKLDSSIAVRNVKLRPLSMKSIFNGKDLTGWKKFEGDKKRAKSDFTVTKEGSLNVKNGPGDLQTDGKYGDFVLQLECISNGKHLNSGIFFRCRDNEYQNGYEAQIRNEFKPEATQEYLIEEFDPKTKKLVGKKKEKYTAVDYGTGAIYRRMPARKQMSKDGEWFAMTIVAHGNHFATWVNGVQVCDWTDNRPPSDNARNGYRKEAGHISIQGHDPTTDLSFRNFRIAELSKSK